MCMLKKLTILIPCFNEGDALGKVLDKIPYKRLKQFGYLANVIVIDNNSSDDTADIAKTKFTRVIHETKQGKGYAMIRGFKEVSKNTDIVVMIDGDNTYDISEIIRLIEPIDNDFCDVVVGSRLNGKMTKDSMTYFNRVGNWMLTFLVRLTYEANVTDVCSGFFAWKKKVVDDLKMHIESNGFTLEMEMISKMAKMKYCMISIPISYNARHGNSNLKPIKDGVQIFGTWLSHLFWHPELNIDNSESSKVNI